MSREDHWIEPGSKDPILGDEETGRDKVSYAELDRFCLRDLREINLFEVDEGVLQKMSDNGSQDPTDKGEIPPYFKHRIVHNKRQDENIPGYQEQISKYLGSV